MNLITYREAMEKVASDTTDAIALTGATAGLGYAAYKTNGFEGARKAASNIGKTIENHSRISEGLVNTSSARSAAELKATKAMSRATRIASAAKIAKAGVSLGGAALAGGAIYKNRNSFNGVGDAAKGALNSASTMFNKVGDSFNRANSSKPSTAFGVVGDVVGALRRFRK